MDDRRFDSLVKAVAAGASRRSVLRGLLGLGGAVAAGIPMLEDETDAAPRPTPTPKPVTCPGRQHWNGSACACPDDAPAKCGPDCCTEGRIPPGSPGYSECCDNACCFGTCYGEELCCPTNTPAGGGAPVASMCANGECCLSPNVCINGVCGTLSGCQNDNDCGDCETCNPDTGECSSSCTGDRPQCCVNGSGEYCIAADLTCCSSSDTCIGLCPDCDDAGYCVDRCGCQGGQTNCVTSCCDNASEVCDESSHTCVCAPGWIECNGSCIDAECCDGDTQACVDLYGFDQSCVRCSGGSCETAPLDYSTCNAFGGWCSNGQCLACLVYPASCTNDSQCCTGQCYGNQCYVN